MQVYFADVGQGTNNVIMLGKQRAIVIDTGKEDRNLGQLLHHLSVKTLTCLILSHLDDDHVGGAPALLVEFRGNIERVVYSNDHHAKDEVLEGSSERTTSQVLDRRPFMAT